MMRPLLFTLLFLLPTLAFSQIYYDSTASPKKSVFVRLKDGTTLRGELLSSQHGQVRLKTDNLGELTLDMDRIAEMSEAQGYARNGQFWFSNPFYTNYFGSPTAMTLRKGEATFQNSYIILNGVNVGITDHFTLGGGAILLPGLGGQVLFITPKVCLNRNGRAKFAIGSLAAVTWVKQYRYNGISTTEYSTAELNGILYGAVTLGNEEQNFTVSAGWGYGNGTFSSQPVITASYLVRTGRKVAFITENWLVPGGANDFVGGLVSGGVRLFGENIGGDLGFWTPIASGLGRVSLFPYAALKVKFGRKKNAVD